MKFDKEHKVIIDSMNKTEARAFVKFLQSEIIRHQADIEDAGKLMGRVASEYNLGCDCSKWNQLRGALDGMGVVCDKCGGVV